MSKLKILILEDNPADSRLLKIYLGQTGLAFDATITSTKKQFIEAVEKDNFDIILSDHNLPGFDSIEALKIARAKNKFFPFIIVSGVLSDETALKVMEEGADDYLLKYHFNPLSTAIDKAIETMKRKREKELVEMQALRAKHTLDDVKTLKFLPDDIFDFLLVGIVSQQKDYRLCHELNQKLSIDLQRQEDYELYTSQKMDVSKYPLYRYENDDRDMYFVFSNLPSEKTIKIKDELLIPEQYQIDYFLMVQENFKRTAVSDLITSLRDTNYVLGAYPIDVKSLRSREHFLV